MIKQTKLQDNSLLPESVVVELRFQQWYEIRQTKKEKQKQLREF